PAEGEGGRPLAEGATGGGQPAEAEAKAAAPLPQGEQGAEEPLAQQTPRHQAAPSTHQAFRQSHADYLIRRALGLRRAARRYSNFATARSELAGQEGSDSFLLASGLGFTLPGVFRQGT